MKIATTVFVFLFVALLSTTWVEGGDPRLVCDIKDSCDEREVELFRVQGSDGTGDNSHAQLLNATEVLYNNVVCCYADTGSISDACDGGTTAIRLDKEDNAHVESPELSNYQSRVCLRHESFDVLCDLSTACTSISACVGSISAETNAHFGSCNYYSNKICCSLQASSGTPGSSTSLPSSTPPVDGIANVTKKAIKELAVEIKENKWPYLIIVFVVSAVVLYAFIYREKKREAETEEDIADILEEES